MRTLLLLRGAPGCGKSTWIEHNGLKAYTLSADEIRLMCQSPMLTVDSKLAISQDNDIFVWKMLFELLEKRMQNGEFTVIDATNSKTSEMNKYKDLCTKYRYRIFCVDFTDIPIDVVKERNISRPEYKRVPESVIDNMYARFETQKIPSGITVIKPDELHKVWIKPFDASGYSKIHIFGDIHGCNTVVQEYLSENGGMNEDELYIFCGDYIDRGIENADVVRFLLSVYQNKNVVLLEGNHERWIWAYAHDEVSKSKEFELYTKEQLREAEFDKKDLRRLYRKFVQCAYFTYYDKTYLVTHGGLSYVPDNLTLVSAQQMIKGVGNYNDFENIAHTFDLLMSDEYIQIHGHRNTKMLPPKINDKVYNLEGQIEFGGHLRVAQITEYGIETFEIKNNVYKKEIKPDANNSVADLVMELRNSKLVTEKQYGNISSFNFTKEAFYKSEWNDLTTKARGLYIDIPGQKIAARSYEKFFNINERDDTKLDVLANRLQFPVTAYVKYNGFLGIVSYDRYNDDLLVTTKSSPDGDYAKWFKEILYARLDDKKIEDVKNFCRDENVSLIFECIDPVRDPHIIKYSESTVILLDIISNDVKFKKRSYSDVRYVATILGLQVKYVAAEEFATWQEFYDWYNKIQSPDYMFYGEYIEGFVIEDASGYMLKIKLAYYHFWKHMRSIAAETIRKGYTNRTSSLTTSVANDFYGWLKKLVAENKGCSIPQDIVTLRDMYYDYKENETVYHFERDEPNENEKFVKNDNCISKFLKSIAKITKR